MDELTFAEVSLLRLDRAMRELSALHEALQTADDQLLHAEALAAETKLPPSIKIMNDNVQSIGVSLVNTHDGLMLRIGHRGGEYNEMVAPNHSIEVKLDGS